MVDGVLISVLDLKGFLEKAGGYFPKQLLNSKLQPISTLLQKDSFSSNFFDFIKTVLFIFYLTF